MGNCCSGENQIRLDDDGLINQSPQGGNSPVKSHRSEGGFNEKQLLKMDTYRSVGLSESNMLTDPQEKSRYQIKKKERRHQSKSFEKNQAKMRKNSLILEHDSISQKANIGKKNFVRYHGEKDFLDCYEMFETVGQGAFGRVEQVRHKKTNEIRAAKYILVSGPQDYFQIENEIQILKELDHPNILKIHEYFTLGRSIILITDFIRGGSLYDNILKHAEIFNELTIAEIMRQLMSAICYIHARNILHTDIKPDNIMVERFDDKIQIKLIDFGTSELLSGGVNFARSFSGTFAYMAPQHLAGFPEFKSDVFAAGIILYTLFSGKHPFFDDFNKRHPLSFDDALWEKVNPEPIGLISGMLANDTEERLSAEQVLHHEWLQKNKKISLGGGIKLAEGALQNLKKFHAKNKIEEGVMVYLASSFQQDGLTLKLKRAFHVADQDDDGQLSYDEVYRAFLDLGRIKEEAKESVEMIFKQVDLNKNQKIDFSEFIAANLQVSMRQNEHLLRSCFDTIDKDGSGQLDIEELKSFIFPGIQNWNDQDQKEAEQLLIKAHDVNKDGKISFEEFVKVVNENRMERVGDRI